MDQSKNKLGGVMSLRVATVFSVAVAFAGCHSEFSALEEFGALESRAVSPAEAKAAFGSQENLTKALEHRWPVTAIKEFCIPERRHNILYQNLVTHADIIWEDTLHANEQTGFDKIEWYANTHDGHATKYSLGVQRGSDYWLLEIGDERTLTKPPDISPDPKQPHFVGHK